MGKQTKSKPSAKTKRSTPYTKNKGPKKATVEVTYDGDAPAATKLDKGKARAAPAPAAVTVPEVESEVDEDETMAVEDDTAAVDPDAPTFKVIAGSYEKLLYGLQGAYDGAGKLTLEPIFIFPAHLRCVKAVGASPGGKWLATGSEDEFIKVWDLRRKKEVGSLSQHTGSITSVTFPTRSHLLATSDDATLSLFRTSDWALLKSLKGHSGRVNHVDVHPTGRVALSVGKDQTLKMWDLMRGRGAASLALGSEAELVRFSPRGTHFAVLFPKKIEVYSLKLKLLHTLETKSRYNSVLFADIPSVDEEAETPELLLAGTEKGVVEVYEVDYEEAEDEGEQEEDDEDEDFQPLDTFDCQRKATFVGHTNRIKSMSTLPFITAEGEPTALLATVSTDGFISVYDIANALEGTGEGSEYTPEASYNTQGTRLTCVSLADGGAPVKRQAAKQVVKAVDGKRASFAVPADEEEEEEDDEEEEEGDMYENSDDESEGGMQVEIEGEDEEEEEEEDEGEYED